MQKFDKIMDFDPLKSREKSKFQNSRITFLYHLDIYLHEQIWLNLTSSFLWVRRFMLKIAIFSAKWDFPYIS